MNEEEEQVTIVSNGMNEQDSTNIVNSCNNGEDDDEDDVDENNRIWGTWEELVLTSAVKRHGFADWDSVAKEITSRSSLIVTAGNCKLKYQDLRRRFHDSHDGGDMNLESAATAAEEKLRCLRVAELRRELQRCDDSILSLELKVKKLEDEKDEKPDLEMVETKPVRLNRETTAESDRENRSINESNSTASVDHKPLTGDKPVEINPDPEEGTVSKGSGMSNSGELGESGTSGKRRARKYKSIGGGSGGDLKMAGDKSQPLIEFLKLIKSHPRCSVFETRLRSQEAKDYKKVIRQHLDIKTIENKLEKGSYVSSSLSFYRDLKLLFTNAIVFYPPSSSESVAAHELRNLVSNEIKKQIGSHGHSVVKGEAETSVSKRKSSDPPPPLVVCKKKSSGSKKTSPNSSSSLKQKDEKKSKEDSGEKTVTTTTTTTSSVGRSSRRANKKVDIVAKTGRGKNNNNKKQTDSSSNDEDDEKEESNKTEKKVVTTDKKKSVADFLKRIKKTSPQKGKETTTSKDQKKTENVKKETTKSKPRELRSNSTGKKKVEEQNNSKKSAAKRKQPKKEAEEGTTTTAKRGRETGKDSSKQQPKKRTRR